MDQFYVFILRNDVWIYIVSALGLFWYISQFIRAQRQLRVAIFNLERETNTQTRNTALIVIVILAGIIGGVYYVNTRIAPTLPPTLLRDPTPTPDIFRTPLSSPTPLLTRQPTSTPPLVPTITLAGNPGEPAPNPAEETTPVETATAVGTPLPPPTPSVGCTLQLNIIEPRNGSVVAGTITFNGTANFEDFGYYTLEANGPQTGGQWASLLGRNIEQSVQDGFLGSVNLSQWDSGPYLIRLSAADQALNIIAQCVIQVTLQQ
ncbi:hypothetical protein [Candidatus Leptofilum sp.]|uniref:hypothetical protein n=1 Tax=Candidatus Leptofilum sp. TaxID=3241576 RepID=UPI003B5C710F